MKTFTYTKITGHHYCQWSEDWEEDGVDFDYDVEDEELLPEIVYLAFKEYFQDDEIISKTEEVAKAVKKNLKNFIKENDLIGVLADQYEDMLKDIFKDEAMRSYND